MSSNSDSSEALVLGIDTGGTYTDGVLLEYHSRKILAAHKSLTTKRDFSIGIELEGADDIPYTEAQYRALAGIAHQVMMAWPEIDARRITGHSDIAPGRKTDPGPAFDWHYFMACLDTRSGSGELA